MPIDSKIEFTKPSFEDKQRTLFERIKRLKNNPTLSERGMILLLEELKIKFIFQKAFIKGDYYCIVDFYLPRPYKLCIEVDGGYHFSDEMRKKDAAKNAYLKSRNLKVLRLSNDVVKHISADSLLMLINKA